MIRCARVWPWDHIRPFHTQSPVSLCMAKKSKAASRPPPAATPTPTPSSGPVHWTARGFARICLVVQPNCAQSSVQEVNESEVKLRLNAPPRDGEANLEVVALLARALGARKGDLAIVQGHKSRTKVIELTGNHGQTADQILSQLRSQVDR